MPEDTKHPITYRRWFLEELFDVMADIAETAAESRYAAVHARREVTRRVTRAAGVTFGAFLDGTLDAPVPATLREYDPLDDGEDRCDGCGGALAGNTMFVRVAAPADQKRLGGHVCAACATKLAPAISALHDAFKGLRAPEGDGHAV